MSEITATRACVLTPVGRGAVATVAILGPRAKECVARHFTAANGRTVDEQPIGRIVFGRWGGQSGEEVVLCRRSASSIEVHCHGGHAASAAILEALVADGCEVRNWQQWVTDQETDAIAAEARLALAAATTERTAAILLDQYHGALARAIAEIEQLDRHRAILQVNKLLRRSSLGLHLTQPWQVVIAGEPNVGKSSLINALVGYDRSIVFDTPGTTRDIVTVQTALDGWPVQLSDTAGLRDAPDPLEADGVQRARAQLAAADLIVLVFDASQPWRESDAALASAWPNALLVRNKIDLGSQLTSGLPVSAVTGDGLPALQRTIVERLVAEPPVPGDAVPFNIRQINELQAIRDRQLA